MKEVLEEIFAPLINYFQGLRILGKDDLFAQNVLNENYGIKDLTKITLGALIISTIIEQISTFLFEDDISMFSIISTPILNELIWIAIFFFVALINTIIARFVLKPKTNYKRLFFYTFLVTATVTMLTMPILFSIDFFIRLFFGDVFYNEILTGLNYGYFYGQVILMGSILNKLYGVKKEVAIKKLGCAFFLFSVVVGLLLVFVIIYLID